MVRSGTLWYVLMRRNGAAYLRERRIHQGHLRVVRSAMVRHDANVADLRPHTKKYDLDARTRLGIAVMRAREADGHMYRPSFAELAGISVASLLKLETGRPVGPGVYETVARALSSWDENTPKRILEGGNPPPTVAAEAKAEPGRAEPSDGLTPLEREVYDAKYLSAEEKDLLLRTLRRARQRDVGEQQRSERRMG